MGRGGREREGVKGWEKGEGKVGKGVERGKTDGKGEGKGVEKGWKREGR